MRVRKTLLQDKPKVAQFQHFPNVEGVQRWVLIEFDSSHDQTAIPVALTSDLRQVRLSFRVSVYSASGRDMRERLSVRNILLFGEPLDTANSHLALEQWGSNGGKELDSALRTAMSEALELAINGEALGEPAKDGDLVDLLSNRGPQRIDGRLIRYRDGKALIVDQSGHLLLVPCLRVL
jgi:hypothetical protein